jgi:metallo-beta-lactamase family protein
MKISFHGGARTVTGSKHLITLNNGTKILLDCGLFQGCGADTDTLNASFGFAPAEISFVILSHAHIDHSGLLPKLVKEGFTGKIYCTPATRDLTEILLYDSAELQTYAAMQFAKKGNGNGKAEEPLYTMENVDDTLLLFETVERDEWFAPSKDVRVLLTNAGHLAGSAVVNIAIIENGKETTIAYSGDVGRYRSVLLAPPAEFPQADYIILESTYGNKHHDISFSPVETLLKWINKTCIRQKGKLVIPAFSVGRTQEILYTLNQLELEKRLPPLRYFVDSPLSLKATTVIKQYVHHFNDRMQKVLEVDDDPFAFEGLKHIETVEDSIRLTEFKEPCVIISASGTADGGRVRHHIHTCLGEPIHTILLAGYCSNQSLGGRLLNGSKTITLFGDECSVAANVDKMEGMSAHADSDDLLKFMGCQDPGKVKGVFLVHGEYLVQQAFAEKLERKGFPRVNMPDMHAEYALNGHG